MVDGVQLGLGVVAGQKLLLHQLHQTVIGHIGAVVGTDQGLPAGGLTDPGRVQLGQEAVQLRLALLSEGEALAAGLSGQGGAVGQALHGQVHQVVVPALAGGLVVDLLLHRLGGVKQVLLGLFIVDTAVVILHVGDGILDSVDIQGSEVALEQTAVPDHQSQGGHHDCNGHDAIDGRCAAVLLFLLAALLVALGLGRILFFGGCTHSCSVLSFR